MNNYRKLVLFLSATSSSANAEYIMRYASKFPITLLLIFFKQRSFVADFTLIKIQFYLQNCKFAFKQPFVG